jgi:hypothetical protein
VWKFFERVEAVLTDQTKLEIAVWLLGVKVGQKVEPWPSTCVRLFDEVFGWNEGVPYFKTFLYAVILTVAAFVLTIILGLLGIWEPPLAAFSLGVSGYPEFQSLTGVPIYISVIVTRLLMYLMGRTPSAWKWTAIIGVQSSLCLYLGILGLKVEALWFDRPSYGAATIPFWPDLPKMVAALFHRRFPLNAVYPVLLTSIWLWLYASSGFVLKGARHFDIGFQWFNRHFEIEKKPLQCIGLVAGAIVALVYWAVVVVIRVV